MNEVQLNFENWLNGRFILIDERERFSSKLLTTENPSIKSVALKQLDPKEINSIRSFQIEIHQQLVESGLEALKKNFEARNFDVSTKSSVIKIEIAEIDKFLISDKSSEVIDYKFRIGNYYFEETQLINLKKIITELQRGIDSYTGYILTSKPIKSENWILYKHATAEIIFKYLKWLKSLNTQQNESSLHEHTTNPENLKNVDVIIYLNELGIIDFIRKSDPFNMSLNKTAKVLSKITKIKHTSIEPILRALLQQDKEEKNNPYNNTDNVNRIKAELAGLGFMKK